MEGARHLVFTDQQPYLPRRHIRGAFDALRESAGTDPRVLQMFEYCEKTWFRSTTLVVGNLCPFRRVVRTNNDTEGWHRRLNSRARHRRENLSMYALIPLLHREAAMVDLHYQLVGQHQLSSMQRQASKYRQVKLSELWTKYEEKRITTSDFLRACASVVPF